MTLKEEVLAAQAHSVAIGVGGNVTTAFNALVSAIDDNVYTINAEIYNASSGDVQTLINKRNAIA